MALGDRIRGWFGLAPRVSTSASAVRRGPIDHILIMDGTLSSLEDGQETNAGITYKLLCEQVPSTRLSIRYEAGVQWKRWRDIFDVVEGRGIDQQIRRAYGYLASRYHPGDRVFLMGYSRGAYAARSLAGIIDRVGLLKAEHANVRNIRQIYRHYQFGPESHAAKVFAQDMCHTNAEVEMLGVWDTVKALGMRAPLFWRFSKVAHEFHDHGLGPAIRHGYQALAMDETREAFAPVLWETPAGWNGTMVQMWFRGCHSDIGGQLSGREKSRPLANIPLVWMLEQAERCGIALPQGWRDRFVQDASAPSVGTLRGWGMLFFARKRRVIGRDASEQVHASAQQTISSA